MGDDLFLVGDNGIVSCRDAETGELHWRQRMGGDFSASPVHVAGCIYLASERGVCTVIAAGRQYRQLGATDLGEPILASFAVADEAIFVRTESSVYRIE